MTKNSPVCLCPLASGSKGNSVLVTAGDTVILVDAGLSGIEIQRRMQAVGVTPDRLSAIIVTHEHTDHVQGVGVLSRRFHIPVYITRGTYAACTGLGKISQVSYFACDQPFSIDGVTVTPFTISHDVADPVGLTLSAHGCDIGIATDLGKVTHLVRDHLQSVNLLYLESNHDPDLLMMTEKYPWALKQRIKSRMGHLSNADAAGLTSDLLKQGSGHLAHVVLGHLSEECNRPELAENMMKQSLNGTDIRLSVARQDRPGAMISLST